MFIHFFLSNVIRTGIPIHVIATHVLRRLSVSFSAFCWSWSDVSSVTKDLRNC